MLKRNPEITPPMTQSPDVRGVTIDFGDAPAHGRWRALALRITLLSPRTGQRRTISWRRCWRNYQYDGCLSRLREPYERVEHIKLTEWELLE
jgi:hypothetical protein